MANIKEGDMKRIREEVRKEMMTFFGCAEGIACVALALQALMGAAQGGAVVESPDGDEVVDAPDGDEAPETTEEDAEAGEGEQVEDAAEGEDKAETTEEDALDGDDK